MGGSCAGCKRVVYLQFSTSNHNSPIINTFPFIVVYLQFSTSNHNCISGYTIMQWLYIFSFLHQTTTWKLVEYLLNRCISLVFYIKPQLQWRRHQKGRVVYLQFSTSNHNIGLTVTEDTRVVYLQFSTSNHNSVCCRQSKLCVVYLQFSTSNHNCG